MSTQTTDSLTMFEHIMYVATKKAAEKSTTVTLVVAPKPIVHDFMQAIRIRDGQQPHSINDEVWPLVMFHGAVVFGVQIDEKHPHYGTLSCWDSDQIRPDISTCPQLVGTPRPNETFDLFGHTLWGCQVEDWMAEYHAGIAYLLNSKTEKPLVQARLMDNDADQRTARTTP